MNSTIEAYTGIICSCLPLLPPLLDKYWPKDFGSSIYRFWSSGSRRKSLDNNKAESEVSLQLQQQNPWQRANYVSPDSVSVQKEYRYRSDDGNFPGRVNAWERIAWAFLSFLYFLYYLNLYTCLHSPIIRCFLVYLPYVVAEFGSFSQQDIYLN